MRALRGAILLIAPLAVSPWIFLSAAATEARSTVLTIAIENVSDRGGRIQIALYDRASHDGHDQKPILATSVEAKAPETIVTLPDVLPGVYALKMFQDIHRSGTFAMNKLGMPEEPFGFSNDALPLLDQPSFDAAKFDLTNDPARIVVHLRSTF